MHKPTNASAGARTHTHTHEYVTLAAFPKPENFEKVRLGSLLSLKTNTGLGLVS
jgi:hypothetical protein